MGIGWGLERKIGEGMGNESWSGGSLAGDWMAGVWLEGKLAGTPIRGLEEKIGVLEENILAGSVTKGVFYWHGNGGEKLYGYWQGVGGRISVSNNICM